MSSVKNTALVLMILSTLVTAASAGPTSDKKMRDAVDEAVAKGAADVKDCGKTFKITFDWDALDKLDWSKAERTKEAQVGYELYNVRWVGTGVNDLCKDKDYKATLQKIDNVVYRTTADHGEGGNGRVQAKI